MQIYFKLLLLVFLLIPLVSADIISINAGGSKEIIINPSKYIEDIFGGPETIPEEVPEEVGKGFSLLEYTLAVAGMEEKEDIGKYIFLIIAIFLFFLIIGIVIILKKKKAYWFMLNNED